MIEEKLTIITATTPEVRLGAPNISVIKKTIKRFYELLGISNCRHIIGMDDTLSNEISDKYFKNLNKLKEINDKIEIYRYNYKSLGKVTMDMVSLVSTPYVFNLEHDWDIREIIDTQSIIDVFDKYNFVNYIRINKLPLITPVYDSKGVLRNYRFEEENRIKEIPLLKEWTYSGNPHFERVSFLNEFCRPIIENTSRIGRKSYESPVWTRYRELTRDNHEFFLGIYVLGYIGKPSTIRSTGKENLRRR